MEQWSNPESKTPKLQNSKTPTRSAFALIEVLLGLAVFALGIIALGRAAQNCVNASTLSAEEERVRQILSNRMAEIQTSPVVPDPSQESQIDTGFGVIKLTEKSVPAQLLEPDNTELSGISLVTLTAQWARSGLTQSRQVEFYVYRPG